MIILLSGFVMLMRPTTAKGLGVLVLILSLVSFIAGGGFLFVGLVLGVVGGILGIIFKPGAVPAPSAMSPPPSG